MRKNIFHVFVAVPWIDIYHWEGGGGGIGGFDGRFECESETGSEDGISYIFFLEGDEKLDNINN